MKSEWISGGVAKAHVSTRGAGETDDAWRRRQMAEVLARWQNGEAPDSGTSIRTSWTSGAAETKDPDSTLRAWIDEHLEDVAAEQVGNPLP